jgi:Bacterial Ig-like domain (group 3)
LTAGNHAILASYGGDANLSVQSKTVAQTVGQADTTTVATSSANPSFITNSKNDRDVVVLTATVTAGGGPVALSGSITFTDNGNAITNCSGIKVAPSTGTATCTPPLPGTNIITLTSGANTILAQYSGDPNFTNSSNADNLLIQNVQDFSLAISSAPPVTVSQGYTTTSDQFTPQTISVAPVPIAGFATATGEPLNLSCSVADLPGETSKAPACKLYILGSTSAGSTLPVASSGAQQSLGVLIDATSADPGSYSVTVTGTDPTTGLVHSTTFQADVRFVSTALSFQSGATSGNTGNVSFVLPPKVTLSKIGCLYIAGTGITSTTEAPGKLGVSCSITPSTLGVATASAAQNVTASVTVSTNNSVSTAALVKHSSLLVAGLFGIPIFALMGFRRRRGAAQVFFRLFLVVAASAAVLVPMGCGGSVHTITPPSGGTTPPGEYLLLIQGQGSDGLTYSTVLQVDVEL